MKKIKFITLLLSAVLIAGVGCVKDKGFEDHQYGINDPDASPAGVGFLNGVGILNAVGLDVSTNSQGISTPLTISLLTPNVPTTDVHVTLAFDSMVVTSYDTANHLQIVNLDPSLFHLQSTQVTIPAGSRTAVVQVNIDSTTTLDPNIKYGIGLRIANIDGGYIIASNQDEIVLQINVKNQYDGVYELHGQFYHPTAAPTYPTFTFTVEMWTTGANSVEMYSPDYADFLHPWSATTDGAITAFGSQSPEYTIDPVTNEVTVQNVFPGAVTFYTMGMGYDNAGYDSHWDPATKTIYANFGYNQPGGVFDPATTRAWIDTLIYIGPR